MLKTTLYGAAAAGLLFSVGAATPAVSAPVAPTAPQVEKNVTDVQHRHWRRHHRHYHRHYPYGYYYGPPAPGIYFGVYGPRYYYW